MTVSVMSTALAVISASVKITCKYVWLKPPAGIKCPRYFTFSKVQRSLEVGIILKIIVKPYLTLNMTFHDYSANIYWMDVGSWGWSKMRLFDLSWRKGNHHRPHLTSQLVGPEFKISVETWSCFKLPLSFPAYWTYCTQTKWFIITAETVSKIVKLSLLSFNEP